MPFEINLKEAVNALDGLEDAMEYFAQLVAVELLGNIKEEVPVDEGNLQNSWQLKGGGLSYSIISPVEYALIVHEGRGVVTPKKAKALRWFEGNKPVFSMRSGPTKPNPYANRAISETESRLDEFIDMAIDNFTR